MYKTGLLKKERWIKVKEEKANKKAYVKYMKEMSFENAMQELEEITGKLEKGNLSLDESVASFEEGMKLAKKCNNILEDAEKKIKILVQKDENIEEEDFKIEE